MAWTKRIDYTFWPVGQGLFTQMDIWVSTKFVRVVYDCGTLNYSPKVTELAMAAIRNSDIDLLVISHFHFDHISRIPELLRNAKTIKEVWIPYLTPAQRLLFAFSSAVAGILSDNNISDVAEITTLIASGQSWFESRGATVVELGNPEPPNRNEDQENEPPEEDDQDDEARPPHSLKFEAAQQLFDAFNPGSSFIAYKTRLQASRTSPSIGETPVELLTWFRPIDQDNTEELMKDLSNWFSENGLSVTPAKLLSYRKNKINCEELISLINTLGDKVSRSELRKIYKKLNHDLNSNSIFLLAHPTSTSTTYHTNWPFYWDYPFRRFNLDASPSILWTGDAPRRLIELFLEELSSPIRDHLELLLIHQFPHHGSTTSRSSDWLRFVSRKRYYPNLPINLISVGKSNSFGHPSPNVLLELESTQVINEGSHTFESSIEWR